MNKLYVYLIIMLFPMVVLCQAPEKFNYQMVVRDDSGNLLQSQAVAVQISILQFSGDEYGYAAYVETQTATTNANGLLSLEVGNGTLVSGAVATVDWGIDPHYIKAEIDIDNNGSYDVLEYKPIETKPYALYAKTADTVLPGPDGETGDNGITTLNGTVDPSTEGVDNDFYINTATNKVFGPKTTGVWPAGVSLRGAAVVDANLSATNKTNSKRNCNSWLIPYLVYNDNSTQIVYLTRVPANWVGEGTDTEGNVSVEVIDDAGTVYDLGTVAVLKSSRILKLAKLIEDKLTFEGFNSGRLALRITVEHPENVYLVASYTNSEIYYSVPVECIK